VNGGFVSLTFLMFLACGLVGTLVLASAMVASVVEMRMFSEHAWAVEFISLTFATPCTGVIEASCT